MTGMPFFLLWLSRGRRKKNFKKEIQKMNSYKWCRAKRIQHKFVWNALRTAGKTHDWLLLIKFYQGFSVSFVCSYVPYLSFIFTFLPRVLAFLMLIGWEPKDWSSQLYSPSFPKASEGMVQSIIQTKWFSPPP